MSEDLRAQHCQSGFVLFVLSEASALILTQRGDWSENEGLVCRNFLTGKRIPRVDILNEKVIQCAHSGGGS